MQEINLLQNKLKDRTESWDRKNTLVMIIFGILATAVLAGGGFLYFLNQSTIKETQDLKASNVSIQQKLDSNQNNLVDAKSFQAQLRNIDRLLGSHIYWSPVFDELQKSILKNTQYVLFQAKSDGKMHVEGTIATYSDLAKLVLSLSTDDNLENVKLLSVQLNSGQIAGYRYAIDFTVKPELLIKK